jgi:glyoxylase-like metal-dependent hydrolase (beta-lactamase superfamily II)
MIEKSLKMKKTKQILFIILMIYFGGIHYPAFPQDDAYTPKTDIRQIDKQLTLYLGGGGNSGILVTDSAVVVIDTKMGEYADSLYKLVKAKAGKKKIIVINTHYHGDHTGGNHLYKGSRIFIGNYDKSFLEKNVEKENMPTVFVDKEQTLYLGHDTLQLFDLGQAHTFHDMVVYLKNRNILFTGDLVFNRINPFLIKESGCNVDGWISALKEVIQKWGGSTMVPGHGLSGDKKMVMLMKSYFEDLKTASTNPDKAEELKLRYKSWKEVPGMTSVDNTIKFIRENP